MARGQKVDRSYSTPSGTTEQACSLTPTGGRYRYSATSEVAKLSKTSLSPVGAVSLADKTAGRLLVEGSIRAQAALGADAYMIPGWMPDDPVEDPRASYSNVFETIGAFD